MKPARTRKKNLQGKKLYAKVAELNGMLPYEVEEVLAALRMVILESLKNKTSVSLEGLCDFNLKYNPPKKLVTSLFPEMQKTTKASTTVNVKTRPWLQDRIKSFFNTSER